ncbi:hypothetical protein [Streptomyces cavernae]|uniref:hypothetical protein n=1 Tax=Streptomyces cavernae TaxID=2259034 RepID=UPI000FEBF354|nr:hypothetical protein [Streptomyces cavernae]
MAKTAETVRQDQASAEQASRSEHHEGAGFHIHTRTLHAPVPLPYLTKGDLTSTARAATARLPGRPQAKDLAFYGGLGAMAVAGALEWPVAAAVGGATWLVRSRRKETREEGAATPAERPAGDTSARTGGAATKSA